MLNFSAKFVVTTWLTCPVYLEVRKCTLAQLRTCELMHTYYESMPYLFHKNHLHRIHSPEEMQPSTCKISAVL